MPDDVADDLEQQAERERLDRLQLSVRLFTKQERYAAAQSAVDDLKAAQPESSEVFELQGDVLRAQGKRKDAREAFQKAIELDKSNARAERKYAELVLFLGEQDRAQRRRQEVLDDPESRDRKVEKPRNPLAAVILACIFPGFGQLYNRQHEKGLGLFAVGAVVMILLINALLISPSSTLVGSRGARRRGFALDELWEQFMSNLWALPLWEWALITFAGLLFLAAQAYGIVDAAMAAKRAAQSADDLGIEAPG